MNELTLSELQKQVSRTAVYPEHWGPLYPAVGLVGEAGEALKKVMKCYFPCVPSLTSPEYEIYSKIKTAVLAAKDLGGLKKKMRGDGHQSFPPTVVDSALRGRDFAMEHETAKAIGGEGGGDCLWYSAELCRQLGLSLNDVAKAMLAKLKDRQERGVLKGNGDER